jgi:acyl-coenzyme A synthetase/AMP-(fatty) acid ligase
MIAREGTWRTLGAPHSLTFVKELPKTATGKIQKYNR